MTEHQQHTMGTGTPATRKSFVQPLLWIVALEAVSAVISMFTTPESNSPWYRELVKADLNPPSWAFGVVWPTLYALIAIAGYRIWQRRDAFKISGAGGPLLWPLFLLQLVMNWAWSFIFFTGHLLWPASLWIMALVAVVGLLVTLLWRHERISAYLLLPYLGWICLASYLSWFIAAHN